MECSPFLLYVVPMEKQIMIHIMGLSFPCIHSVSLVILVYDWTGASDHCFYYILELLDDLVLEFDIFVSVM